MNKEALFARSVDTTIGTVSLSADVEVTVRALSHAEVEIVRKAPRPDVLIVTYGLTDPDLSKSEVEKWFKRAPAGDIVKIVTAIRDLSGLGEGAGKSDHSETE